MSDVPEGYKMSEVGVIPEGWEVDEIKNISSITTGTKNTQDKIDDGEYPFYVRSSIIERINSYSFDGEAVLTAGDGVGTGKVIHYINGKFDFHQRVYKISGFSKKIEGYFFYLFFSNYFLKRIMTMTAKSSVDSVRMEMIAEMPMPFPPLPEQQFIASALSDVDAPITALEQLITKKRYIKQGVMQQLLTGKKRLPGFSGEWEVKKLGEITKIFVGKDLKEENFSSYADNIFKCPVYSNTVDNEGLYGYYNIAEYQGDSLSVVGRGVGLGTAFNRNGGYGAIGRLLLLFPDINVDTKYLCEYINQRVKIFKESSGIPQLTGISLAKYKIPLPPTIEELRRCLPWNYRAKGDIYVFVDECHRTQSGKLHKAMNLILPNAIFIGFTGTPLLKKDKKKSIEVFGKYIHTYKFDEAVKDNVVLDLRYEARNVDQNITSQAKIDQWFDAKTRGLTDYAKIELKKKWGTMKRVLSSQSRLEKIVVDIIFDMATKDRLQNGAGNAMLVSGSIYQACKYYELFQNAGLKKCAI